MKYPAGVCLVCNETVSSVLIDKEKGGLLKVFSNFADYIKLEEESVKGGETYRGKLFPFCGACSSRVHQLFEYHQEKVRILQLISELVNPMTTQILASPTEEEEEEGNVEQGDVDPEYRQLIRHILSMRKSIVEKFSPRVVLSTIQRGGAASTPGIKRKRGPKRAAKKGKGAASRAKHITELLVPQVNIEEIPARDDYGKTLGRPPQPQFELDDDDALDFDADAPGGGGEKRIKLKKVRKIIPTCYPLARAILPGVAAPTEDDIRTDAEEDASEESKSKEDSELRRISRGQHSYRGITIKRIGSRYRCGACTYSCLEVKKAMLPHIDKRHFKHHGFLEVRPNEFLFCNKYTGFKDPDGTFRCGEDNCGYTTPVHYYFRRHFMMKHEGHRRQRINHANILELSDSNYQFLNVKYTRLENGTFRCLTCDSIMAKMACMTMHIRRKHLEDMSPEPEKPPKDYAITPTLYCLPNSFICTKVNNSFKCSACGSVRDEFKAVYNHVYKVHYSRIKSPRLLPSEEPRAPAPGEPKATEDPSQSPAETETPPGEQQRPDKVREVQSEGETCVKAGVSQESSEKTQGGEDPQRVVTLVPAVAKSAGSENAAPAEVGKEEENFEAWVETTKEEGASEDKEDSPGANSEKRLSYLRGHGRSCCVMLCDFQVQSYQYKYMDLSFQFLDGQFRCDTCGFFCEPNDKLLILKHIDLNHYASASGKVKRRYLEVNPGEYVFLRGNRGFKQMDGSFKCGFGGCSATFKELQHFVFHCSEGHIEEKNFVCEHCGKAFKAKRNMQMHMDYHVETKNFACTQCDGTFQTKKMLVSHVRRKHEGRYRAKEKRHQCHLCGKAYTKNAALQLHIRVSHSEVKPSFTCDLCNKSYLNQGSLTVHKKLNHSEEKKKHSCPICNKEFKYANTITRHIMVQHNGMKSSEVFKRSKRRSGGRLASSSGTATTTTSQVGQSSTAPPVTGAGAPELGEFLKKLL